MNPNGHSKTLVAAHPGNKSALKHGVHSPQLIAARAAELEAELFQAFTFTPTQRVAAQQVARCLAILEAIDRDLDERGLVDRNGKARHLLAQRSRVSRELENWLSKIANTIDRQTHETAEEPSSEQLLTELRRIAMGHDSTATTYDRLTALRELLKREPDPSRKVTITIPTTFDVEDDVEDTAHPPLESHEIAGRGRPEGPVPADD